MSNSLFVFAGLTQTSFSSALSVFSAIRAYWLEARRYSFYNSAVFNRMAILAKSNPVAYLVSQFWIVFPLLYVVRVDHSYSPAFLAGIIIPLVNGIYPFFVFIPTALLSIRDSGSLALARLGAVFIVMTSFLGKLFFAPTAGKGWWNSVYSFARLRTILPDGVSVRAYFPTNFTGKLITRITELFIMSCRGEKDMAFLTFEFVLSRFHKHILPYLERFYEATGITPELVE